MFNRLRSQNRELQKETMHAVHEDDLEAYLDSLGILGKMNRGQILCKFCHEPVSKDTLHSLFPESGDIKVVCDTPSCVIELMGFLRSEGVDL